MKFGLLGNARKSLFWEKFPQLLAWFRREKIPLVLSTAIAEHESAPPGARDFPTAPPESLPLACDIVLAFGGDGTILRTVKITGARETPVLGINVGGLGFLTEIPLEKATRELKKVYEGRFRIERRLIIEGKVNRDHNLLHALNEISIDKGSSIRVIQIEVRIGEQLLNSYVADGLIISTPTGSTGYSLACGGPVIVPSTDVLIVNPICPHSLTNRPVIIPADSKIRIRVLTEADEVVIGADGQDVRHCKTRTRMTLQRAPFDACLVKPLNSNFYHLLHTKLHWGEDFRDKNRWSYDS